MQHKIVLLILDDVSHSSQLQNLVPSWDCFGRGSRILITTRDKRCLIAHEVDEVYEVKTLDDEQAMNLFSLNAFRTLPPPDEYLELVRRAIHYAQGLPLALIVLGSLLYCQSREVWIETICSCRENPPVDIQDTLKLSYDALGEDLKEVFLDVACFFKGENVDRVEPILQACYDLNTGNGIEQLQEKALLRLDKGEFEWCGHRIWMLDMIEKMGKKIANPKGKPNKSTRLWNYDNVKLALTYNTGTKKIKGIHLDLDSDERTYEICLNAKSFSKMENLRYFYSYDNIKWSGNIGGLSGPDIRHNRFLQIFIRKSLLIFLTVLTLHNYGMDNLPNLKYMVLSGCESLTELPDFNGIPNLIELCLDYCQSLVEIQHFIGSLALPKLRKFDLAECNFSSVDFIGNLHCLETLNKLDLSGNNFVTVPALGKFVNLAKISLRRCYRLREIPELPPNILEVDASDCESLERFSMLPKCLNTVEMILRNCYRFSHCLGNDLKMMEYILLNNQDSRFFIVFPCWEVPKWFQYCSKEVVATEYGPSSTFAISFEIPSKLKLENIGVAICFVSGFSDHVTLCADLSINGVHIHQHTYKVSQFHSKSNHMWLTYIPLSGEIKGKLLGGWPYKCRVEIVCPHMKSCGVHLVCQPPNETGVAAEPAGESGMLSWPLPHHEIVEDAELRQVEDEHETLPHHLKRLFMYCSLFPFGYEFRKDELVQLWIAEGFIRQRQKERMEDTATEHFNSLVKEGLFVFSGYDFTMDFDSVILYKVNPSKHSLLEETISSGYYFRAVDGKLDGATQMTRHLSLIGEDIDGMAFGVLQNFKHLCTLHMLSCCGSSMKHVPRDLCFTLTFLKTLNLSGTSISELPSSIGNVKSLRYIDASHTQIAQLPESIDSLHNLQTIKLRGCIHFVQLPKGMKKLSNLRHIDLDIIRQLDSMPGHLGNLTNLQTLPAFLVGRDHGCRVGELKNLNDLKGSFIISRLENVLSKEEAREASLIEKKRIHRLELRWSDTFNGNAQQEEILKCLQPHTSLVELQIQQYSGSILPNWISNPTFADLVVITFYRCRNCKLLPCMGQLPALKSLSIIEVNEVKEITHQFFRNVPFDHAFPKLEILEIDTMLSMKEWKDVQMGDLPSLIKLTVDTCPELVTIPPISCLKSLKHLEFRHCPKLLSLPADGLPTGLESFIIVDCHELKEWCRSSDHWSILICHVPSVWFDNQEGAFGMTHQQAQAQGTAQASQSQSYTLHIPNERSTSMTQLPFFTSNTTPPKEMPSGILDSGVTMKELYDISHSDQRSQPNDDGYNWRKYGQKRVKGSEFSRSYYKCTRPSCPVRKRVERSVDGQITEIIYEGEHNHQRPQSKHPKDSGNQNRNVLVNQDLASRVHGDLSKEGNYLMSKQDQESSPAISWPSDCEEDEVGDEVGDEDGAKGRYIEVRHPNLASSPHTLTEPRFIVQTTSEFDVLDDGYRWRKKKKVNYSRSYYKCAFHGCNVWKHTERAATNPKAIVITYKGKHNHDVAVPHKPAEPPHSDFLDFASISPSFVSVKSSASFSKQESNDSSVTKSTQQSHQNVQIQLKRRERELKGLGENCAT